MKKTLSIVILSTLCLAGSACKKTETEKAADKVADKTDKVGDKAENVGDQARDISKEAQDMQEAKGDLANADQELAAAKQEYTSRLMERLAKLDEKIADAKAKGADSVKVADLQARRDALAQKISDAKNQTSTAWSDYKDSVEKDFDDVEKAVDDAT